MNEEQLRERIIEAAGKVAYHKRMYLELSAPDEEVHHAEYEKWQAILVELRIWLSSLLGV